MSDEQTLLDRAKANYAESLRQRPLYTTGEPRLPWDELVRVYGEERMAWTWTRSGCPASFPRDGVRDV